MTTISYARVAAVIRFASIVTANKLTDLGQKNETQFMGSLKEFLAFFCTVACNEICIRTDSENKDLVPSCYSSLRDAFFGEQPNSDLEPLRVPEEMKLLVAAMVNAPESNFHSYFWSYWNGDLHSLRVSPADIEEVEKRGVEKPSHGETGAAAYALLVRTCRYENPHSIIPPTIVFLAYDKIIREEVNNFLGVLRAVLG